MHIHRVVVIALLGTVVSTGWAQTSAQVQSPTEILHALEGMKAATPRMKPYSMTQTVTTERTFGGGLTQTQTTHLTSMRDSHGRTRDEREYLRNTATTVVYGSRVVHSPDYQPSRTIFTYDPVDRISQNWSVGGYDSKVAHVRPFTMPIPVPPPARDDGTRRDSESSTANECVADVINEQLGRKNIQNMVAEGSRRTTRYSQGCFGMNQPYVTTMEQWMLVRYPVMAESTMDDPRLGRTVTTLTSFSTEEPSVDTFKIPTGLKVVKDTSTPETAENP